MKTVHKLILKSYVGPMVLSFFIVLFVFVLQFIWRYIDELVGKGLGMSVIMELMMYASLTLIPTVLPLATLFAAVMTMGNMGENYELLALKSAGISLPKIMRPLLILIFFVSIGSFFLANDITPLAFKKMSALIYDIRRQQQVIEFKDGLFFNLDNDMSIRVEHQDPKTKLLTGVLIYDAREAMTSGKMRTIVADSGYISLSDDKKYLLATLYNGEMHEDLRNYQWMKDQTLDRRYFDVYNMAISMTGFDFARTDVSLFSGSQTKNIQDLSVGIDSLRKISIDASSASYRPLISSFLFTNDPGLGGDTVAIKGGPLVDFNGAIDSLDLKTKQKVYKEAASKARSSLSFYSFDESTSKDALSQLYKYEVEWHKKISLPVSILIFFLIGAPLGAIIRKGGLGMPVVVSVGFFVVYYIIMITGEKMAKEGTWNAFIGTWIATFILFPISFYLTYKATSDSNLFNAEWYQIRMQRLRGLLSDCFIKRKNKK